MFKRVLIANRGEIAIRIARAAAALGIDSVAVFAAADALSLHTRLAGAAREIGAGGDPVRGYLDIDAVVAAAKASGCDCVHPGYGFLSENAGFAQRCQAEGLRFIGPAPATLALFGDKVAARAFAQAQGIPVVPGAPAALASSDAAKAAGEIDRLPGDAEGRGRRRRARHARRGGPRGNGRGLRALPERGRGRVRRRRALRREDRAAAAPHRGAGPGRRPGQCRAPLRARLLGAAAQPEGRRDRAGAQPRRGPAPAHPGRRASSLPAPRAT